ncbi:hypothetical protein pEaSNUABM9_00063 [Erwinia phage pEa_SNUABM_9]|nr:hypothetical protein pEaSNUABM9_00063 [Erwinia phage pEa_SNUABM_9]
MIRFVTYKAYLRIIENAHANDVYLSGYDCQTTLKYVTWDLFQYLIHHFNPYAGINYDDVVTIVRVQFPAVPRHVAFEWAEIVRRAMCEEFNIAYKGYTLTYELDDEFVRVTTKKVMESADDLF